MRSDEVQFSVARLLAMHGRGAQAIANRNAANFTADRFPALAAHWRKVAAAIAANEIG